MGGTIRVIIKRETGKVYNMLRWTNTLPDFINNPLLISKDEKHLDEYLEQNLKMEQDWKLNKETKKFKYPMTDAYFPNDKLLTPYFYGIIVIDYQTETIISMQEYFGCCQIYDGALKRLGQGKTISYDKDEDKRIRHFHDKDLVNKCVIYKENGVKEEIDINKSDIEGILDSDEVVCFYLNMSPWKFHNFDTGSNPNIVISEIEKIGFKLSEKELEGWNQYHQHNKM